MILQKLAFLQKFNTNYIGLAISTRDNWEEELERWGPQVDTLTIDSSNACFDDAVKILKASKKKFPDKPFGIGNIIQGKHFDVFAKEGADYIIGGMGVGSICQTGSERGNGRGQFTVARELAEARDRYAGIRYVPIVIDGGIGNRKDMTVALAFGDLIMMGNYFNRFYEAAGKKLDEKKDSTSEENLIRYVETWGEGHPRARLVAMFGMNYEEALRNPGSEDVSRVVERYGHSSISSATIEGKLGTTEYRGRLKPCVESDARYIRTTIRNSGASNLSEFRQMAGLEKASPETIRDMYPHDIEVKEK
jgi:IMP dehydrogenase/GMP reductase